MIIRVLSEPWRVFLVEELVMKTMMNTRITAVVKFRAKLGINQHHPININ